MANRSVRYKKQLEARGDKRGPVSIEEGIESVKKMADIRGDRTYKNGKKRKAYDQTVELTMHLGIDAKQADQMLRGAISLPKGTGKKQRAVFFLPVEHHRRGGGGRRSHGRGGAKDPGSKALWWGAGSRSYSGIVPVFWI